MGRFIALLADDRMPIIFTIIIGIIAFQVNKIYDTLLTSPVVEYSFDANEIKKEDQKIKAYSVTCNITNITRDKVFKDLAFDIRYPNRKEDMQKLKARILNPDLIPIAPSNLSLLADSVTFSGGDKHETMSLWRNRAIALRIPELQPNMQIAVEFEVNYNYVNKKILPSMYFDGKVREDVVLLREKSLETWIIKNQIRLNMILIGLWFLVIFIFSYFHGRKLSNELKESKES